jgi:ATP-dependent Clp protease ATP-binding subunit ClpC
VLKDLAQLLKSSDPKTKGVLMRFLQAKNINIIGIATPDEYHSIIKDDPQMDQLFEKIFITDSSDDETKHVLMTRYLDIRRHGSVKLTYKALKSVLELTKRFVSKGAFPGKAVSVFEDAYLLAKNRGEPYLREDHIREIVSLKANLNVQKLSTDDRQRLITLEQRLRQRIIGQQDAIIALVNTLKRAGLEINSSKKPLGTFLFLGPTGVGKTQTAKVLAEEYFGSIDRIIRVDLNEYSTADSVTSIAGGMDLAGGFREGFLTKRVQDNPLSLILLDEIEKAHPNVLNMFLQILDEGSLIDGQGVKTDFRNTIIIATSNAGALTLRDILKDKQHISKEDLKSRLLDAILRERLFSPEFVNRFDEVIVYHPLTQEEAGELALMMLDEVIREVREKRGIEIELTEDVLHAISERGYNVEFGAREMRRVVQETIETYLADYLLKHDVKRGAKILITLEDLPKRR